MDFEMAIWEMTSLLIAPKKVFRSIYYHVRQALLSPPPHLFCIMLCMVYADFAALQKRKPFLPALPHGLPNPLRSAAGGFG